MKALIHGPEEVFQYPLGAFELTFFTIHLEPEYGGHVDVVMLYQSPGLPFSRQHFWEQTHPDSHGCESDEPIDLAKRLEELQGMFRWNQAIRFAMDEQRGATDIRNDPAVV